MVSVLKTDTDKLPWVRILHDLKLFRKLKVKWKLLGNTLSDIYETKLNEIIR